MVVSTPQRNTFTPKQIGNFVAFGETLRKIHARLIAEGYVIEDGHITKRVDTSIPKKSQSIYNLSKEHGTITNRKSI